MMRFEFDPGKCTACGACAIACMDQNDIDVEGGQRPYRRVFRAEWDGAFCAVSTACLHCPDAPCAAVCPKDCLVRDPDSGLVLLDNGDCVGCRACERVCPIGAPTFRVIEGRTKMEKCDGCRVRVLKGLSPACVLACPTGAIALQASEDRAARDELAAFLRRFGRGDGLTI